MSQPGDGEDEPQQRPEVSEEDLLGAKDRLGSKEMKGKTMEVMEECEKAGKTAPSVFSGARSGVETVFNKPSARPIRKK